MRWNWLQILLRQREHFFRCHIPGNHHGGVARRISHLKVMLQILHRPVFDVAHPSHHRPLIRMRDKRRCPKLFVQHPLVLSVHAASPLARHHPAFTFNFLRIEAQIANPIPLDIKYQLQRRTRKPVLIHGHIPRRIRIVRPAIRFHRFVEIARPVFLRAVEHHVLEKVRQPGRPRPLVARPHPVKRVQRHVRDAVVRLHQNLHPVLQRLCRHRIFLPARPANTHHSCQKHQECYSPVPSAFHWFSLEHNPINWTHGLRFKLA